MKTTIKEKKIERIVNEYSVKCHYCKKIIRGSSQIHSEKNYDAHLWFKHGGKKHDK